VAPRAAPFAAGEGCPAGFTLADDAAGEAPAVGFAAAAEGFPCPDAGAVGFAVALTFADEASAEVGRGAVVVATGFDAGGGVLSEGCDWTAGQQPASTSRQSTSAESRVARSTRGWYRA
jgi:hypothetical protein